MKQKDTSTYKLFVLVLVLACATIGWGQTMQDNITNTFNDLLSDRLSLSPGEHANHFLPSSVASSDATIQAFTNFITTNISSFPLSSTSAGLTFDFSSGQPVSTTTSLGPLFAERAQTLGRSRFNFGFNFSYFNLNKIRGLSVEDIRFTFTHEDVGTLGNLGDSANEFDNIDLFMNMDLNVGMMAAIGSFGVTDRLDIGVAIPFVSISMEATPHAAINSFTTVLEGAPNHFFTDANGDTVLAQDLDPISSSASGIGDIALRAKYNFMYDRAINAAALFEYRLATGDEADFLGTGSTGFRGMLIFSGAISDFSPHLNIGYDARTGDLDRNEIEMIMGFDHKLTEAVTVAIDLMAEIELAKESEENVDFPEDFVVERTFGEDVIYSQTVSVTNIPRFEKDNFVNASFGLKFNPKEGLIIVTNALFPLNNGGMRSSFIPTFGLEFSF